MMIHCLYDNSTLPYHVRRWVPLHMIFLMMMMLTLLIDTSKSQEQYQSEDHRYKRRDKSNYTGNDLCCDTI